MIFDQKGIMMVLIQIVIFILEMFLEIVPPIERVCSGSMLRAEKYPTSADNE